MNSIPSVDISFKQINVSDYPTKTKLRGRQDELMGGFENQVSSKAKDFNSMVKIC